LCGAVKLPGSLERGGYTYLDEAGQRLPAVCGKEADYVWIVQAKPFGAEMIKVCGRESASGTEAPETFGAQDCADSGARCSTAAVVDTPYYHGEWNASGQLTQLYDKTAGRNVLAPGKCGNILQIFEDKPRCFDAWELEPTIDEKCMPVEDCRKLTVERNELGTFVHTEHVWHDSHIRQTVCFYERKRRIDFVTHVDWREHQKLLKAAFPVDIRAVSARYDIQEGNIVRPIVCNTSWDAARFETVAHKWVDFSETGYGIALLNNCKYGHDIKDNTIRLSLLKSAVDPDYDADNGQHEFTYSLLPHEEEWYAAGLEQEAFSLNEPLTAFPGRWRGSTESAIRLDQDFVEVDAVKRAENGDELVLRFHEYTGRRGKVKLKLAWKPAAWCECNLMEEPCTPWQNGAVEVEVTPYEIKTLLFQM
ncbi:MAG: alpha-mannosidase, partial [Lachnospiraceae bacterium]|nr:alpha-mannosidase [Lachnospiraceae bacterium]